MNLLPKEITPNPLLNSSVELRFVNEFSAEFINEILPKSLKQNFDMERDNNSPQSRVLDPNDSVVFKNEAFMIIVDKKSVIFENAKHYQLWDRYFPFIKAATNAITPNIQSPLERIGIRYVSFFAKSDNQKMMLKKPFLMIEKELGEIKDAGFYGSYAFSKGKFNCYIQFGSGLKLPGEKTIKKGCVIDLDLSVEDDLPNVDSDAIFTVIDELHTEEKKLFLLVLNDDFLGSLNVIY
ncbi:hypothetical protein GCM10028807_52060 [Spirosoma daeguense]